MNKQVHETKHYGMVVHYGVRAAMPPLFFPQAMPPLFFPQAMPAGSAGHGPAEEKLWHGHSTPKKRLKAASVSITRPSPESVRRRKTKNQ